MGLFVSFRNFFPAVTIHNRFTHSTRGIVAALPFFGSLGDDQVGVRVCFAWSTFRLVALLQYLRQPWSL